MESGPASRQSNAEDETSGAMTVLEATEKGHLRATEGGYYWDGAMHGREVFISKNQNCNQKRKGCLRKCVREGED